MSPLEVHDPGLRDLIASDADIERIAGGLTFTEGPVWRGTHLLFSDIPNKRIVRWRRLPEGPELTTFATGMSNGLTLDRQGRVLAAEHDGRRVTRIADDGARTVLAEHFQGKRLNSPTTACTASLPTGASTCWRTTLPCRTASPSHPTSRCCTSTTRPTSTSGHSRCALTA